MDEDNERVKEPLTDAELRSWEAMAPFGQVTISGLELRRLTYELRRLRELTQGAPRGTPD